MTGLALVYISCKTDLLDLDTILDLMKSVSLACSLMTLADVKEPEMKTFVDAFTKPIGRYRVEVGGKMICG